MNKTPLEKLLETGFSELGVEFGRRVYAEEVLAAASVDDALEDPVSKFEKAELEKYHPLGKLLASEFMTDAQLTVSAFEGRAPFFMRVSGEYGGWIVRYTAQSSETMLCYEPHADRLVSEGKVEYQTVELEHEDGATVSFSVNGIDSPSPNYVRTNFGRANFASFTAPKQAALASAKELDGQKVNPEQVYQAVMALLKA